VVVEQVDFVHVQDAAIGGSQDAGLKVALAALDGLFDVQRAHHAVFGGADRQIDERRRQGARRQRAKALEALAALVAEEVRAIRVAVKAAALDDVERRQQGSQSTRCRGLGGATFAADQHAADLRVDGVENESAFHALLSDDSGEWISLSHE
jgi:hypothetical protein